MSRNQRVQGVAIRTEYDLRMDENRVEVAVRLEGPDEHVAVTVPLPGLKDLADGLEALARELHKRAKAGK